MTGMELELRLIAGFAVVLASVLSLDKLGDYLFHRGIAKPFYFLGYRVHHRGFVVAFIPATYAVVATLIYLHYMRVLWSSFWPSVEVTILLAGACLAIDFVFDALSTKEKRMAIIHHEWVYFVVPAYAFTHLIALVYTLPL
jgi:hypothetical protein